MNYEWKKKIEEGQSSIGYLDVYETSAEDIDVRAIIHYFPELNEFGENKICNVTFMYACSKEHVTDGFFHCINDDVIGIMQEQEDKKFKTSTKKFHLMMTQQFFVQELPGIIYFTHGDYSASQ